jgi:L-lactate dehydrogenase complex protein LldG
MSSRDDILAQLRYKSVIEMPYPDLNQSWIKFADPIETFIASVTAVGGEVVQVDRETNLTEAIDLLPVYRTAKMVASCSTHAPIEGGGLDDISDPHDLENLDVFIADGVLGVAENGAIWLTDEKLPHRVALFITQHLILTVRRQNIVHNMHEAYQQINVTKPGFGVFISGPSKTADIEQSLVIGAHGARSLTVFILDW